MKGSQILVSSIINKKVTQFRHLSEEKKIIILYRYISLIITSTAFLFSETQHSLGRRLFIITCIAISSILLNYLYLLKHQSVATIKLLLLIETLGNSVLLIPCGGLGNPYVWYALNTILIASVMLNRKYCWFNLFIYLSCSTWITYIISYKSATSFIRFLYLESNLIVSSFLMTIAIMLLAKYITSIKAERKILMDTNLQLTMANIKVKESLSHIMELYQAVHLFVSMQNKEDIINCIKECLRKFTRSNNVFFCYINESEPALTSQSCKICRLLMDELPEQLQFVIDSKRPVQLELDGCCYILTAVKSNGVNYGFLGVESTADLEIEGQLKFVAELSSIAFERFEMERVSEHLIVAEEQNRIANEIHDSVMQRLFGTSFSIYALMKKLNKADTKDMYEQLDVIREAIDSSMKELRSTIYGLSWKKGGDDCFAADTVSFLNEIRKLSKVDIDFNIIGNSELLSIGHKKILYRIICEGVGNAVRHGKAKEVKTTLHIQQEITTLEISDNGSGFDMNEMRRAKKEGMGIRNIYQLINSLKGKVEYQSIIGEGTRIKVLIPNSTQELRGDMAI